MTGTTRYVLIVDGPAFGPRPWPWAPVAVPARTAGRDVRPTRGVGASATGLPVGLHEAGVLKLVTARLELAGYRVAGAMDSHQGTNLTSPIPEPPGALGSSRSDAPPQDRADPP